MAESDDGDTDRFLIACTGLLLAIATNTTLTDEEANGLFNVMPDPELQARFRHGLVRLGLYRSESER